MTEFTIKLEDADAANAVFTLRSNYKGGAPEAYKLIADQIEEQIPPTIEEPEQFGSIVRAKSPQDPQVDLLWTPTPRRRHYWMSVSGLCEVWSELADVEVLRVGVGEVQNEGQRAARDEAYARGYEDGVQSNLPSPVDRSNILSAVRDGASRLSEQAALDITDAIMKVLSLTDIRDRLRATVGTLKELQLAAVTAPEKRCYDMAASIVASLLVEP